MSDEEAQNEANPEELIEILTGKTATKQENKIEEPEEEVVKEQPKAQEKPKELHEDLRDKLYDVTTPSGFDANDVAGVVGKVDITESDKELYLKAILNDEPVVLDIPLMGGKLIIKVRAKTAWETTLVYQATISDTSDVKVDYYQAMLDLQKFGASLQIMSVDNKIFSDIKYDKDKTVDWKTQRDELKEHCEKTFAKMSSAKFTLLLNALRVFEYKISVMASNCLTGDFWKPVG